MKTAPPNAVQNLFSKCGTVKHAVLQGSVLEHLLLTMIFDIKHILRTNNQIIFADDTSIRISSKNVNDFCTMATWFCGPKSP